MRVLRKVVHRHLVHARCQLRDVRLVAGCEIWPDKRYTLSSARTSAAILLKPPCISVYIQYSGTQQIASQMDL